MLDNANANAPTDTAPTLDRNGRPVRAVRDCFIVIKGVAPRCRKADTHIVPLGDHPVDVDVATLEPQARAVLARYKSVTRAKLCLHYAEIGDGFKTTMIFDPRHIDIPLT